MAHKRIKFNAAFHSSRDAAPYADLLGMPAFRKELRKDAEHVGKNRGRDIFVTPDGFAFSVHRINTGPGTQREVMAPVSGLQAGFASGLLLSEAITKGLTERIPDGADFMRHERFQKVILQGAKSVAAPKEGNRCEVMQTSTGHFIELNRTQIEGDDPRTEESHTYLNARDAYYLYTHKDYDQREYVQDFDLEPKIVQWHEVPRDQPLNMSQRDQQRDDHNLARQQIGGAYPAQDVIDQTARKMAKVRDGAKAEAEAAMAEA